LAQRSQQWFLILVNKGISLEVQQLEEFFALPL